MYDGQNVWDVAPYGVEMASVVHREAWKCSLSAENYPGFCFHGVVMGAFQPLCWVLENFLHPDKPLHRCNNQSQIKSNWIRKSPGLIDTNTPRCISSHPERRGDRKTGKPHVCSLGYNLNTLWEWSRASLGRGHLLAGLKMGGVKIGSAGCIHQTRFLNTAAELVPGTCRYL